MMRWVLAIQDYDIAIQYIEGKNNIAADALSRALIKKKDIEENSIFYIAIKKIDKNIIEGLKNMKEFQQNNPDINKISKNIKNYPNYSFKNNL